MGALVKSVVFLGVIIAITVYAIVRIVLTVALAPEYSLTDRLFSFGLLLAELFILLHASGYAVALLRATRAKDIGELGQFIRESLEIEPGIPRVESVIVFQQVKADAGWRVT